ncbi:hypothetical protein H6F44_11960 [Pseudanabaena sp. FACHB-1277]|jgi:hypothetical protein|uniref:Uncharacterized protein n=1 Tax=Pseudanabaena cinerea FACHB-1277 TaxID=2949581 RepID=A0A926Z896_9CYAN|nr:hypothetical protein [Pseudanabaena cinerea]MBD2150829.1 hypothetical protein [Pseudanabaena cinerea FACHB-1277]
MIWIVIATHLIISIGLLWATWQVWLLRNALKETVVTVDSWTEACESGLQFSTPSLEISRQGVGAVKSQYQALQEQLEKIRKLLSVLGRGVSFVGGRWRKSNNKSNNMSGKSVGRSSGSRRNGKGRW